MNTEGKVESDLIPGSKARARSGVWREIHPYLHPRCGYYYVDLRSGPTRRNKRVNVLVLETFIGPRPDGTECLHGDGNPLNNRLDNLRWGTPAENAQDRIRHGTIVRGERQKAAKLDRDQVREIRKHVAAGGRQSVLCRRYGVSSSVISEVASGKAWSHVGEES